MREVVEIAVGETVPDQSDSLVLQGIASGVTPPPRIIELYQAARELFVACARPVGLFADITPQDFAAVYRGEGRNEADTPVNSIFTRAERLALFAVTVGHKIHERINDLFETSDFALASMLDSVASAGVERAADVVEERYGRSLDNRGSFGPGDALMRYSPGYCGWHVSGQKRLFDYLRPAEIGIELRASFLMEPLKSISGVLICGPRQIHVFEDDYAFCGRCEDRSCRIRTSSLIHPENRSGSSSRAGRSDRKE